MATITYSLSPKVDKKTKKASINLRFIGGRKIDVRASSGFFVNPDRWSNEKMCVIVPRLATNEQKELFKLQTAIDNLTNFLLESFINVDKSVLNKTWLFTAIDMYHFPEKYIQSEPKLEKQTILAYIGDFIVTSKTRRNKVTGRLINPNNIQQYEATKKHIEGFARLKKVTDFEFCQIDEAFYDGFVGYLQGLSFKQNTVGKHIRILKLMLNAAPKALKLESDYSMFHVFTEDSDAVYLDENELNAIKDVDLSETPHLSRVRDWFLILAWTGSRFSDLEKVGKSDIVDGMISFRQTKTNTKVTIPIHPVVLQILEKYNYRVHDPITNQKFNEYIKEVVRAAKITSNEVVTKTIGGKLVSETIQKCDLISSHTGRRSFCTNMYKRGLPSLMIMSISGHKTEKSFLKYIRVKQHEHAELMQKAWKTMYYEEKALA